MNWDNKKSIRALSIKDPSSGCWNWIMARTKAGYGIRSLRGRLTLAHRVSYEVFTGTNPGSLHICHRCDNPACVNPDHLFAGTPYDNWVDCKNKGRCGPIPKSRIGTSHHLSVLDENKVREIRAEFSKGRRISDIARDRGVSHKTIWMVVKRVTWKHVN